MLRDYLVANMLLAVALLGEKSLQQQPKRESRTVNALDALQTTFDAFKIKYGVELERFKAARDKLIAHSEHPVKNESLPSFDTMEQLFLFGCDFYAVISSSFVGSGPADLDRGVVKRDLIKLFKVMGLPDIEIEMK